MLPKFVTDDSLHRRQTLSLNTDVTSPEKEILNNKFFCQVKKFWKTKWRHSAHFTGRISFLLFKICTNKYAPTNEFYQITKKKRETFKRLNQSKLEFVISRDKEFIAGFIFVYPTCVKKTPALLCSQQLVENHPERIPYQG